MPERAAQTHDERGSFDRFAELSASFVSRAVFFATAFVVVLVWMPLILVFESIDTWQLVLNTVTWLSLSSSCPATEH